ncbi:DUF722 domain-containing protein [Weissella koreensis]|uniref:DUF722 domain-containing protein n=1 Tax=Weissella koreensis TaxID=165096 RepID=UPI000CF35F0C|nr:DUF722 domain-containing protein [Weissella koreensis]AVH74726.1 transcriptional regulator [Weissella koreensis]QGN19948.1 DUF722 domain-containing protein [Weissella koreensis]
MADKVDRLIRLYFQNMFPKLINLKKAELAVHTGTDENIGGGKLENNYNNPVEGAMSKAEMNEDLNDLIRQEYIIGSFYRSARPDIQEVLVDKYRKQMSWVRIASDHNIDEKTARRWRDDFKRGVSAWIP